MPACSKTKTRPRGGVAAGQRRARGPRTHTAGHSRSSTECSRRGSVRSSANAPGGTGGVVATARASRGNKARRAGDISASRAIMFKRLFGAEKSGGGSAPSAGSTGGGGGGKTTPLGAVEQLKDVRHPRSNPRGCLFFGNPTAPRVPCAVARRKARGRSRNVAFSFLFCQKSTLFSSLSAPLGVARSRTRVRASSSHATLTPRHSLRDTRSAPPAPPPSRRPSPCWRSARRCCTRRWRRS